MTVPFPRHGSTTSSREISSRSCAQRSRIRGTASLPVSGVFSDIAVDRLLGDGVTIDHLNDDVLGRTLDVIAAYGPTELFNVIVAACLLASDYGTHCLHVDTTAFSVSGEYDADFDSRDMTITYGRPWDGRWALKQFILGISARHPALPADLLRERVR
ncbi:DUF4277 domain-containing protein [Methanoculleus methanifontis]|uniref:DUF4277 domain-containing protein n=1 Tax=Methanoculleus methanifontis TaxID=2584086 RepID=UPI002659FF40|nr:DUF4277 domain-containing protein [Methanoculleus sp. FWC-SCC3]